MCVSAEVSFGLSAGLVPAGIYCVKYARVGNRHLLPVAVIPIFFGVQQFAEGLVWTGLRHEDAEMVRGAALVFLFFALFFWPFWVPFCAFFARQPGKGKSIFALVTFLGLLLGLGGFVPLIAIADGPLAEVAAEHSINYGAGKSATFQYVPLPLWELLYVGLVSSPLFTSPTRKLVFMGVALVLTSAITFIVYRYTFASVWCFSAAVLSLYLCVVFRNMPEFKGQMVPAREPLATS